ncbi:hypothetical protein LIER_42761 [Lithospermum erythrorhizon]|uniref:Uncharacterized protein n=1 Tax=Lithospermum erythrorhizon TaxID=34254 RepID=A0AAV3NWV1_LITER
MSEQHSTSIATLSSSTGSCLMKNFHSESSISISTRVDTNLVSSKLARLKLWEEKVKHIYENATKNFVLADIGSTKVVDLKDIKKEYIEEDDAPHCVLRMIPNCILDKKDPIDLLVWVVEGTAKIGTPLCIPCRGLIYIGRIVLMLKHRHIVVDRATKGDRVLVKVMCEFGEQPRLRSRMSVAEDLIVSCKGRP